MNITKTVQYVAMGIAVVGAFLAGNMVVKWYQTTTPAAKEAAAMVAQYRPGFMLPDLDGRMRDMNEWNGKVVVVNFWATWCPPCKREMPAFIELQETYAGQGLQFLGIALDDVAQVQNFVDEMGVEYPVLVGGNAADHVAVAYGNRFGALPYTAIIDREGKIVATHRGEVSKNDIESTIKSLL